MLRTLSAPMRRGILVAGAAFGVWCVLPAMPTQTPGGSVSDAVRPHRADLPEYALVELRDRLAALHSPDWESGGDRFQGVEFGSIEANLALNGYQGGKHAFPERSVVARLAGQAATDQRYGGLRPLLEQGRAVAENLLTQAFFAAGSKDAKK
jgi:hypothetical protein